METDSSQPMVTTKDRPVRYAVIRPAPDLPDGYMPVHLNGLWLDYDPLRITIPGTTDPPLTTGAGLAVATDRYETREDGERARVFEVRA